MTHIQIIYDDGIPSSFLQEDLVFVWFIQDIQCWLVNFKMPASPFFWFHQDYMCKRNIPHVKKAIVFRVIFTNSNSYTLSSIWLNSASCTKEGLKASLRTPYPTNSSSSWGVTPQLQTFISFNFLSDKIVGKETRSNNLIKWRIPYIIHGGDFFLKQKGNSMLSYPPKKIWGGGSPLQNL